MLFFSSLNTILVKVITNQVKIIANGHLAIYNMAIGSKIFRLSKNIKLHNAILRSLTIGNNSMFSKFIFAYS